MSTKALCQRRKEIFLKVLRETSVVGHAARACGISRQAIYDHRERDPEFARKWDDTARDCADDLRAEGHRRAMDGSDPMLKFMLKGAFPETYGDRRHITGNVNISLNAFISALDDDDAESGFDEPMLQ